MHTPKSGLMTSADKTKLAGIEALADVTDATNVDAAGAVMESDIKDQSFINILKNGDFGFWSAGAASAPDEWVLSGGALARESTTVKKGSYSMKVTSGAVACAVYQRLTNYADFKGCTVTLGAWIWCDTAGKAIVQILDGVSSVASANHTGGSSWEWLEVSYDVSASATKLEFRVGRVAEDTITAYFDGAIAVEGSVCPAFSPHPVDHHSDEEVWQDQSFVNLVRNGNFESWSAGAANPPDKWLLTGAGASVSRDAVNKKIGSYGAALLYGSANCGIFQNCNDFASMKGRTVTAGVWIKTSTTSHSRVYIYDGVTAPASNWHTGSGNWEWLTVTGDIDSAATILRVFCNVVTSGTGYFDGAILVEGHICPAFSPHPTDQIPHVLTAAPTDAGTNGETRWYAVAGAAGARRIYMSNGTDWKYQAIAT